MHLRASSRDELSKLDRLRCSSHAGADCCVTVGLWGGGLQARICAVVCSGAGRTETDGAVIARHDCSLPAEQSLPAEGDTARAAVASAASLPSTERVGGVPVPERSALVDERPALNSLCGDAWPCCPFCCICRCSCCRARDSGRLPAFAAFCHALNTASWPVPGAGGLLDAPA